MSIKSEQIFSESHKLQNLEVLGTAEKINMWQWVKNGDE